MRLVWKLAPSTPAAPEPQPGLGPTHGHAMESCHLNNPAVEARPVVTSKEKIEVVCGVPTQVVCTAFSSHILVVVTQYGKMGNLVSLEPSSVASDICKPAITTRVLLGQDEPLIYVFAKNLVTFVSQEAGNKPILLPLALKDKSVEGVKALKEVIRSCQVW